MDNKYLRVLPHQPKNKKILNILSIEDHKLLLFLPTVFLQDVEDLLSLHNFLSFVDLSNVRLFTIHITPRSAIYLHRFVGWVIRCFLCLSFRYVRSVFDSARDYHFCYHIKICGRTESIFK